MKTCRSELIVLNYRRRFCKQRTCGLEFIEFYRMSHIFLSSKIRILLKWMLYELSESENSSVVSKFYWFRTSQSRTEIVENSKKTKQQKSYKILWWVCLFLNISLTLYHFVDINEKQKKCDWVTNAKDLSHIQYWILKVLKVLKVGNFQIFQQSSYWIR